MVYGAPGKCAAPQAEQKVHVNHNQLHEQSDVNSYK